MNEALLARLDKYASDNYLTRTAVVVCAVTQYLDLQEASKTLVVLRDSLQATVAQGLPMDEDTKRDTDLFLALTEGLPGGGKT